MTLGKPSRNEFEDAILASVIANRKQLRKFLARALFSANIVATLRFAERIPRECRMFIVMATVVFTDTYSHPEKVIHKLWHLLDARNSDTQVRSCICEFVNACRKCIMFANDDKKSVDPDECEQLLFDGELVCMSDYLDQFHANSDEKETFEYDKIMTIFIETELGDNTRVMRFVDIDKVFWAYDFIHNAHINMCGYQFGTESKKFEQMHKYYRNVCIANPSHAIEFVVTAKTATLSSDNYIFATIREMFASFDG